MSDTQPIPTISPLCVLIPLRQAFRRLSISNATGQRLVNRGELGPVRKIGRRSYLATADLETFIASRPIREVRNHG